MGHTKHHNQKPKPKKKPQGKKRGKCANIVEFRAQLDALDLKVIEVTADGNCFFRAVADQLEGNEEEHGKYRRMVVQYIVKHREDFEPFIEDGVPFDEYCKSMEEESTWAGNMELQAASLVTRSNICVHRIMEPRWYIRNFHYHARIIHLSYHNEEHYNSVRSKEDPCNGPAQTIVIKADDDLSATSREARGVPNSKGGHSECIGDAGIIKLVMAGSGCNSVNRVEQVLQEVDGDANAAIEFLIALQGSEDDIAGDDEQLNMLVTGLDYFENGECEPPEELGGPKTCERDAMSFLDDNSTQRMDTLRIPENKFCPCGSKKKFKACCGTVNGHSSSGSVDKHRVASGKVRVQRKQSRKSGSAKAAHLGKSEVNLPDMGALCI
ncbi:hypothetical protein IFM89_022118 [Coptis chinensis]|uniref:OTU domain-containing protein n=1 Tax=Coptis chinensis TaxID=261450 RepID=A0A835HP98_9MAGN|nr:hypothetical protein IFM89_022118 [Coptis chinensis]